MSIRESRRDRRSKRNPERIAFAREQRATESDYYRDVWEMLRQKRMRGLKFRRQVPLPPYTLDFACLDPKLDIEIDGKPHTTAEAAKADADRDAFVRSHGFDVLRIDGFDILRDPDAVQRRIEAFVGQQLPPRKPR